VRSDNGRAHALSLVLKLFFDDVFKATTFQTQISEYLFKTPILVFQIFDFADIRSFHSAIFCFPVVITGLLNCGLAADILYRSTGVNKLQNGDNRVFTKSGFTHGDLLQGT